MKVLHIGPKSEHVKNFILALNKEKHIESFLITDDEDELHDVSYVIESLHTLNPFLLVRKLRVIKQHVLNYNPDIIHIHQVNRMGFWLSRIAKALKIPILTTAWGSDVLLMPQKNQLFKKIVQSTLIRSEIITADSNQMIEAMNKLVPGKKYVWLQYGIEAVIGSTKENIVYSNRMHMPLYRIDKIIEFFGEFQNTNKDWRLKIAGSGTETESLKKLIVEKGIQQQVEFVGWLSSGANRKNYETAKIYISVPESDGTSVSLLEAMSAGCIPVVSDLPSNREWIHDGQNGVIWKAGKNPLEEALLLENEKVAEENQLLIEQKATRAASVKRFIELYSEILNFKA